MKLMRPTVKLMEKYYKKYNKEIFNNELGECKFEVVTEGDSAGEDTIAEFWFERTELKTDQRNNRDYLKVSNSLGARVYIKPDNFAYYLNPKIIFNGNYLAPEKAWENSMVHEMAHYWTAMQGFHIEDWHGKEFNEMAKKIRGKSKGHFIIAALSSKNEFKNYTFSPPSRK